MAKASTSRHGLSAAAIGHALQHRRDTLGLSAPAAQERVGHLHRPPPREQRRRAPSAGAHDNLAIAGSHGLDPQTLGKATAHVRRSDPVLAAIIRDVGPCRLQTDDRGGAFAALVESILYQQITGKAAASIYARVRKLVGRRHPRPQDILAATAEALRGVGLSRQKVAYLRDLSERVRDGLKLRALGPPGRGGDRTLIRSGGIGRWTVEMFLIFRLGRLDVLPVHDYGIRKAMQRAYRMRKLPSPTACALAEPWRPYPRSPAGTCGAAWSRRRAGPRSAARPRGGSPPALRRATTRPTPARTAALDDAQRIFQDGQDGAILRTVRSPLADDDAVQRQHGHLHPSQRNPQRAARLHDERAQALRLQDHVEQLGARSGEDGPVMCAGRHVDRLYPRQRLAQPRILEIAEPQVHVLGHRRGATGAPPPPAQRGTPRLRRQGFEERRVLIGERGGSGPGSSSWPAVRRASARAGSRYARGW